MDEKINQQLQELKSEIKAQRKEYVDVFNNIYILLDPLSFTLVKLFCWHKWIKEIIPTTNLFKTYSKVEAEKVLDKLTE